MAMILRSPQRTAVWFGCLMLILLADAATAATLKPGFTETTDRVRPF